MVGDDNASYFNLLQEALKRGRGEGHFAGNSVQLEASRHARFF